MKTKLIIGTKVLHCNSIFITIIIITEMQKKTLL